MDNNIKLYEGHDKYIFVSYCHKDKDMVYPVLEMLSEQGYRLWYDQGIHPGNHWPEIVAGRLNEGAVFMAFLSENYMKSQNCVREIHFAVSKEKDLLSVFLEPVNLSLGIEMQLSVSQAVRKFAYPDDESFYKQILLADVLEGCKEPEPVEETVAEVVEESVTPAKTVKPAKEKAAKESKPKSKSKAGVLIAVAAVLVVLAVFGFTSLNKPSADDTADARIIIEKDLASYDLSDLAVYYADDELDGKLVKDEKGNYLLTDPAQTMGVLVTMADGQQESDNAHSNYLIFREADHSRKLQYTMELKSEHYTVEHHASRKDDRENYLESSTYGSVTASEEIQTTDINGMTVEYIVISYSKDDARWDGHVQAWTETDAYIVNCEIDVFCDSEDALETLIGDTLYLAFNNMKMQ